MNNSGKKVQVRNRSNSIVIYHVDDMGVRREFQPGETKMIPVDELWALSQKAGGAYIIRNSDKGVIDLLKNGSVDALLDCLDFAPNGVIDLVQKYAIELPLTDTRKIRAIKEKTGFDVAKALVHKEELAAEAAAESNETDSGMEIKAAPTRRVQPTTAETTGGRRTKPRYNVVTKH